MLSTSICFLISRGCYYHCKPATTTGQDLDVLCDLYQKVEASCVDNDLKGTLVLEFDLLAYEHEWFVFKG